MANPCVMLRCAAIEGDNLEGRQHRCPRLTFPLGISALFSAPYQSSATLMLETATSSGLCYWSARRGQAVAHDVDRQNPDAKTVCS